MVRFGKIVVSEWWSVDVLTWVRSIAGPAAWQQRANVGGPTT
jgi:hypothetical protein